jgi:succinyl-diaminopimelate desuccinylase
MAEPSSIKTIGDAYKIGRRGSVNFILEAEGVQGHIAEQDTPDNVVSKLAGVVSELSSMKLDNGSEYFQPSNLEFSTFDVANPTENIIPQKAEARFNIRFNKEHTGESLVALIQDATEQLANKYEITSYKLNYRISGEPFISQKDDKHQFLAESIKAVAGIETKSDTNGGTSDLRLMQDGIGGCAEFGLLNDTMHQVDERTSIADLESVKNIFYKWLLKLNS